MKFILHILWTLVGAGYLCLGSWLFGFWSTIGEIQASRLDDVPTCAPPAPVDRDRFEVDA